MTQSNNDNKLTIDVGYSDYSIDWQNMSTSTITTTPIDTTYSIGIDDTIDLSNITFTGMDQKAFEDTMPSLDRVNNMCEEYPALAKAYNNFKHVYKLCEQDYKGKLKERGIDDEIPF
jgi:hypothetical protein